MAIRQERMITLINAAVTYYDIAHTVTRLFTELDSNAPNISHDELRAELTSLVSRAQFVLRDATVFDASIAVERDRFAKNMARNVRKQKYMEMKRRGAGVVQRTQMSNLGEMTKITPRNVEQRPHINPTPLKVPDYIHPPDERQLAIQKEIDEELAREANENMITPGQPLNIPTVPNKESEDE